ncbi:MAG: DUF1156 domain-containing protein [bacterium]
MINDKRFIEETFPVREVSIESAREKNIRHGHISTLHIWWARRPLASRRATNYAALIPAPENVDEWNKQREFIIEFSKWEKSLSRQLIDKAREDILKANGGKPPKVLDLFGGGGTIPLEALRLGCETYSNDVNPVAVLIQKCTLEYPQKYGRSKDIKADKGKKLIWANPLQNSLLEDVKKWGKWVLDEEEKEIGRFYPTEADGAIPVGYIWARTIPCQNLTCSAEIPLMRQFWLAKKEKKKIALFPYVEGGEVRYKIVGDGYEKIPDGFDPSNGTISKAVATCLACPSVVDDKTTRKLFREGKSGQRIIAVVLHKPSTSGKRYRIATDKDIEIFREAEKCLKEKQEKLMLEWGIDPVPDEAIPIPCHDVDRPPMYGMNTWGDLFNIRQKLALITLAEKMRESYKNMSESKLGEDYAKAVASYLGLGIDRTLMFTSTLTRWKADAECPVDIFARQALPMTWDYVENNPIYSHSGAFIDQVERIIYSLEQTLVSDTPATITQSSATSLSYPDNYFDAVFTDPPYYDNVGYANLSDFFYVWLKRTVGDLYPELFSTLVTPKLNEIVSDPYRHGGKENSKQFFESMLKKSFQEIYRVLRPNGITTIVYAHKSTEGWETLINSLLDSGLIVTGAWPINTEMRTRLRAKESAALASSIYIVARKMTRQPTGFYNEVKEELKQHLNKKLDRLWEEGIRGADFFIAAIGSAIEVFGKYEKVMDYEGNIVRADRLLEEVRKISTDYAVHQILHNGFAGEITDLTRFYVLYRWNYGEAKVQFDEANKLARTCSLDLPREWSRPGFIKKEKEFIRVLGPQERNLADLKDASELIDILHNVLLLWEKSKREEMMKLLKDTGYGDKEAFFRVAQAVSETLPIESKEKKLLDGFLAGKERLQESRQRKLF